MKFNTKNSIEELGDKLLPENRTKDKRWVVGEKRLENQLRSDIY